MKNTTAITSGGLLVVSLPLIMAVGCTTGKSEITTAYTTDRVTIQDESMPDAQVPVVIDAMAGDMAKQDTQEGGDEVAQGDGFETAQTQQGVTQVALEADVVEETLPEAAVSATDESIAAADEAAVLPAPAQRVFYFTTDSDQLSSGDYANLMQHAAYLQQHPNMVLLISGHADSRGSQLYNERLSAKRARNVAAILLAAGVSDAQLQIDAVGESTSTPSRWQENRRVDLFYQDTMVARN